MSENMRGLAVTLRLGEDERDALARLVEVEAERAAKAGFAVKVTGAAVLRALIRAAAIEAGVGWAKAPGTTDKPKGLRARMKALVAAGVVTQAQLARDIGLKGAAQLSRWSLAPERLAKLERAVARYEARAEGR